jgi:hypothetical protein
MNLPTERTSSQRDEDHLTGPNFQLRWALSRCDRAIPSWFIVRGQFEKELGASREPSVSFRPPPGEG